MLSLRTVRKACETRDILRSVIRAHVDQLGAFLLHLVRLTL